MEEGAERQVVGGEAGQGLGCRHRSLEFVVKVSRNDGRFKVRVPVLMLVGRPLLRKLGVYVLVRTRLVYACLCVSVCVRAKDTG